MPDTHGDVRMHRRGGVRVREDECVLQAAVVGVCIAVCQQTQRAVAGLVWQQALTSGIVYL